MTGGEMKAFDLIRLLKSVKEEKFGPLQRFWDKQKEFEAFDSFSQTLKGKKH